MQPVERMSREPLFDASIDSRFGAKTPKGVRPVLTISAVEMAVINLIVWFCLICYAAGYWNYPRSPLEEWFLWAPEAARPWMVKLAVAALFAASQTIYPLMIYPALPAEWKRRLPLHFLPWGSPPLFGGTLLAAIAALPLVLFALLAGNFAD